MLGVTCIRYNMNYLYPFRSEYDPCMLDNLVSFFTSIIKIFYHVDI